ncbi:MAG: transposase [Treponema sp.]|nr:transposase [Treponema sp.]
MTAQHRKKILPFLPRRRGNVTIDNAGFIDAIIYLTENACAGRSLPESCGPWHTVSMRFNRGGCVYGLKSLCKTGRKNLRGCFCAADGSTGGRNSPIVQLESDAGIYHPKKIFPRLCGRRFRRRRDCGAA